MPYEVVIGRNQADRERFGKKGTIFLGKHYVKMGEFVSLSNKILMDIARSHVVLVTGKRGSGKSYSLSVIAEEMAHLPEEISKNLSIIMLDTMGVFWTMKYPNTRDEDLLEEWKMKPKGMDINLYIPTGFFEEYKKTGLPADNRFSIKTSELDAGDWSSVFDIKLTDSIGILIEGSLEEAKKKFKDTYEIEDIIKIISKDKKTPQSVKNAAENRFKNAEKWGLFSKHGTEIKDLLKRGEVTVLDLSAYSKASGGRNIKNLAVGIISKKLLAERIVSRKLEELDNISLGEGMFIDTEKELEKPMVWIFIDEAHEFIGKEKYTPTSEALIQLLREGRQPGISLVLATQQPGSLRPDVLTQSDIVIGHRITAKVDIDALNSMMQSYLLEDIQSYMNNLPRLKGAAIILDDNSERIFPTGIRPKMSWHGGEAPSAIKQAKQEIEKILSIKF
ncbi:MAG: DUF87 domain-containing protein [Candidatus Woesearchaeota archaeon]